VILREAQAFCHSERSEETLDSPNSRLETAFLIINQELPKLVNVLINNKLQY